ncbi:MAG: protein kinase [Cyanobacteria bacterium SZAS LIN-2]|nr:protein kinase [Cyanobacteria bacterium SZAS LIN-2]
MWQIGRGDPACRPAAACSSAQRGPHLKLDTVVGGSYRLKRIIGRGGMGVVYLCEHLVFKRDYALKALAPEHINESNWYRFQSEGKAIARLNHRNIVQIYDLGIHDGHWPYYVMDLLEGQSLADLIHSRGPLDIEQAQEIFGQVCAGLGYAHQNGIIHRDVKPSNIILTASGDRQSSVVVKIVDFGLAKLIGDKAGLSQSQTATGEVFGSPLYMSPEQCIGANTKIDERSDIYSLGCTIFECLTGRPPFRGENAFQTVLMHQNAEPPSLAESCPGREFSPALEDLVATMLEKRPVERQQSMAAVAHDLSRAARGQSVQPKAIFADAPLFAIDTDSDNVPARQKHLPLALFSILTLVTILAAVGVVAFAFSLQNSNKSLGALLSKSDADTPEMARIRGIFQRCGVISDGVVDVDGEQLRRFRFPEEVPVGKIMGSAPGAHMEFAQGVKYYLPTEQVILRLVPPEGEFVIKAPEILSHIGAEDIYKLELEPNTNNLKTLELSPEFFLAIKKWKALHEMDIDNFTVPARAIPAMNEINPVPILHFKGSPSAGADIARINWLDKVQQMDLKRVKNVDPILARLAGSNSLDVIHMDFTEPSLQALDGLSACRKLYDLGLSDCDIDDTKMSVISKNSNLRYLVLNGTKITDAAVSEIIKLKRLTLVSVKNTDLSPKAVEELRRRLPHCSVQY